MKCEVLKLGDGNTAIVCGGGRKKKLPKCWKCTTESSYQCDYPTLRRDGKTVRTCDRHLCSYHVQHGMTKGVDFCSEHYPMAKAAWEKRRLEEGNRLLYGK